MQILNCFLPFYELKPLYRNFHVIQRRTIIIFITVVFLFNNNVYIVYFSLPISEFTICSNEKMLKIHHCGLKQQPDTGFLQMEMINTLTWDTHVNHLIQQTDDQVRMQLLFMICSFSVIWYVAFTSTTILRRSMLQTAFFLLQMRVFRIIANIQHIHFI